MEKGLKKFADNMVVDIICRLFVGGMFFLSGIGKLMDLNSAVKSVYNFQLLPWDWAITLIGTILPFIELIGAICILVGAFTRISCTLIGAMSAVFFFGKMNTMFIQGRSIDCGCFGALMNTMASMTVWLDMPVVICCLILIFSVNRYNPGIGMIKGVKPLAQKLKFIW